MVSNVRGFDHSILHDFARDGQVPLPTLRWTEVLTNSIERRRCSQRILQTWIDGVEAAEARAIIERGTATSPTRIDCLSPGRVAAQAKHAPYFRSAEVASGAAAKRGLAITKDVTGQAHSWLEALIVVFYQSAAEPAGACLDQRAIRIRAIVKSRNKVSNAIIGRVGLPVS